MPKLKEVAQDNLEQLSSIAEALNKDQEMQEQNQQHLDELRIQNLKKYLSLRQQLMRKAEEDEIEYEAKARENVARRYNKTLTEEQRKDTLKAYEESSKLKLKDRKKYIKELKEEQQENLKFYKQELKEKAKLRAAAEKQQYNDQVSAMFGKGYTISERKDAFKKLINDGKSDDEASVLKTMDAATKAISNYVKKLESTMTQIASKKGSIDTRLQGLTGNQYMGSYWSYLEHSANSLAFGSPLIKQSDLLNNMDSLVSQGIAYNVEQRAFLATISDRIATTFSVTDATLLRLVKIQQQDTTASRLGMESALTAFLNNMYETTEYMSGLAERTRSSLVEAQALMSGAAATELEYQVQKWMGSLYSVGMSDTAVSSIASVIGQLAAGQIDSITNGSTGNLLVMAANKAGLSISDILANGLDANSSNSLMTAMVSYMSDLYSSSNNKVVQQQLASAFGVSASDLKAAANLSTSLNNVSSQSLTNAGMLQRLYDMGGTM